MPPPLPPQRRPLFILLLVVLIIPILVAVAGLICYGVSRSKETAAWRQLEREARARGEPITLSELAATLPPIPDSENVAVPLIEIWKHDDTNLWRVFFAGMRPLPERLQPKYPDGLPYVGNPQGKPDRKEPWTDETRRIAEQFLNEQAGRMAEVRGALRRPHCRFPMKLTIGFSAALPYLGPLKDEGCRFRIQALSLG